MSRTVVQNRMKILVASLCIVMMGGFAFAKKDPEMVKEEDGFYYGYGKASTKQDAEFAAKKDLIETALTASIRASNPKASRVSVSDDVVKSRLSNVKAFAQDKPGLNVTYRIKLADWEKDEKSFSQKLRDSLSSRYSKLTSNASAAEKINEAVEILNVLAANGETELLKIQEGSTELYSKKVEAACSSIVKGLTITISAKDGFIDGNTKFSVNVADASGKAVSGLKLKASWELSSVLPSNPIVDEVVSIIKTDGLGNANVDYPVDEAFKNQAVTLTVSTAFATSEHASLAMKKLDATSAVDGCYVHFEDFKTSHKVALVPAGEFNAGAVAHDNRAGKKEAAHTVETVSYEIDAAPVTNAEYAAFLHATRSTSIPEYFDNADYNQPTQPVVGVSAADAEAYAEWLSSQTGSTYRLPTEEEWEKAARAGTESIYPWGDDAPNKGKKANYKGNGKFKAPSPVGSFESGNNGWGLVDMAGNVCEWTSSAHNAEADSGVRTVKGGSWMDGPTDLRISNYRNLDSQNGYPDVGFRLVKEVSE